MYVIKTILWAGVSNCSLFDFTYAFLEVLFRSVMKPIETVLALAIHDNSFLQPWG